MLSIFPAVILRAALGYALWQGNQSEWGNMVSGVWQCCASSAHQIALGKQTHFGAGLAANDERDALLALLAFVSDRRKKTGEEISSCLKSLLLLSCGMVSLFCLSSLR